MQIKLQVFIFAVQQNIRTMKTFEEHMQELMKTFEGHWQEIEKEFDFKRVYSVIKILNWTWYNDSYKRGDIDGALQLPDMKQIKEKASNLCREAMYYGVQYEVNNTVSSYGFTAHWSHKDETLTLSFTIATHTTTPTK